MTDICARALELAIKANPSTPASGGSFYTTAPNVERLLQDAAKFLAFLSPPKPSRSQRKAKATKR